MKACSLVLLLLKCYQQYIDISHRPFYLATMRDLCLDGKRLALENKTEFLFLVGVVNTARECVARFQTFPLSSTGLPIHQNLLIVNMIVLLQ